MCISYRPGALYNKGNCSKTYLGFRTWKTSKDFKDAKEAHYDVITQCRRGHSDKCSTKNRPENVQDQIYPGLTFWCACKGGTYFKYVTISNFRIQKVFSQKGRGSVGLQCESLKFHEKLRVWREKAKTSAICAVSRGVMV